MNANLSPKSRNDLDQKSTLDQFEEFYKQGMPQPKSGFWTIPLELVKKGAHLPLIVITGMCCMSGICISVIKNGQALAYTGLSVVILITALLFIIVIIALRAVLKEQNGKKQQNHKTSEPGTSSRSP